MNRHKGFTIIEIVIILAIAGLISLMVFIAFPNLQQSQRDTQRKNDLATVVAAIEQYRVNNHGKLPEPKAGETPEKFRYYLPTEESEVTNWDHIIIITGTGNANNGTEMRLKWGTHERDYELSVISTIEYALCPDEPIQRGEIFYIPYTGRRTDYATMRILENGGYYCRDSRGKSI